MTSLLPTSPGAVNVMIVKVLWLHYLPTSPGAVNVMVVKVLWLHSCLRLQELWMWWLWRSYDFTPAYVSRSCECDGCEGLMTSLLPTSPGAVNVMVEKVLWLHSCLRLQELWMWWLWRSYDFTPTYVSRSCECDDCESLMTSLLPTSPGAVNVMVVKVLWLHSYLRLQELWMWWLWRPYWWLHSYLRLQELWMWWLWRSCDFTPAYVSRSCECDDCEGRIDDFTPTSPAATVKYQQSQNIDKVQKVYMIGTVSDTFTKLKKEKISLWY